MENWQITIISIYTLFSFAAFVKAVLESNKGNAYRPTPYLNVIGSFFWMDAVVFGFFWTIAGLSVLWLQDWILFLLLLSVFWMIRSLGETWYWFNQQFSTRNGNPIASYWLYKLFKNDAVWIAHQLFWQCLSVVTIITSVYLFKIWLS